MTKRTWLTSYKQPQDKEMAKGKMKMEKRKLKYLSLIFLCVPMVTNFSILFTS